MTRVHVVMREVFYEDSDVLGIYPDDTDGLTRARTYLRKLVDDLNAQYMQWEMADHLIKPDEGTTDSWSSNFKHYYIESHDLK